MPHAFTTAGWFWQTNNLNDFADRRDLEGATRKINGGKNGIDDRRALYAKAKTCFE